MSFNEYELAKKVFYVGYGYCQLAWQTFWKIFAVCKLLCTPHYTIPHSSEIIYFGACMLNANSVWGFQLLHFFVLLVHIAAYDVINIKGTWMVKTAPTYRKQYNIFPNSHIPQNNYIYLVYLRKIKGYEALRVVEWWRILMKAP